MSFLFLFPLLFLECLYSSSYQLKRGPLLTAAACSELAGRESDHNEDRESSPCSSCRSFPHLTSDQGTQVGPGARPPGAQHHPHSPGSCWDTSLGKEQHFAALSLQERLQSQGKQIIINQQGHMGRPFPSNEY